MGNGKKCALQSLGVSRDLLNEPLMGVLLRFLTCPGLRAPSHRIRDR